jgi:hypothetical protein
VEEYRKRVSLTGWRQRPGGAHVTLVETVRQDRVRKTHDLRSGIHRAAGRQRRSHTFLAHVPHAHRAADARRLEKAGFVVDALLGDYRGAPWTPRAEVWVILAPAYLTW